MVVGFDGAWILNVPSVPSSRASLGGHFAEVVTSFAADKSAEQVAAEKPPDEPTAEPPPPPPLPHDKHMPPIHCEEHSEQDHLDLVRRRARGEKEQGRGDGAEKGLEGPATLELKKLLKPQGRAKRLAAMAKKHKCPPKTTEEIVKATPWKIEKIIRTQPKKMKPKPKPKMGLSQNPHGPTLCSRHEMINEGPYPLEKRLAELAAHSYYLWGDAKYLAHKAEGTSVEVLAHTIERFARQADSSARNLAMNNHIPMSVVPPKLPLAVSALPAALAIPPPLLNSEQTRRRARDFL